MHVKESSVCFSVGIALLVSRLSSSRTSILEKFIVPVRSKERRIPLQRSIQRSLCVDSPLVVGVSLRVVDHRPHACTRVRPLSTSTRFFSHLPLVPLFPPPPSLAKLYTSPRRSYHDHVQTPSRFSLPNRLLQTTTSFYSLFPQRSYHDRSPRLLTLARLPLDRHSWYHQRRVILSDNISEHTNNLFPFLFPRSFLSFLFILAPVHDRPSQRGKDRRELGGTKGGRES